MSHYDAEGELRCIYQEIDDLFTQVWATACRQATDADTAERLAHIRAERTRLRVRAEFHVTRTRGAPKPKLRSQPRNDFDRPTKGRAANPCDPF